MNITPPRARDWELELLLLQELSPARTQQLEAQLQTDPTLQEKLKALRLQNQQLLEALPAETLTREVKRRWAQALGTRALQKATRPRWFPAWVMAAGLALVVVPAVWHSTPSLSGAHDTSPMAPDFLDETRIKGLRPELRVFRLEGERITRVLDHARVPPGALLQLSYLSPGQPYGLIVSVDGVGNVTLHTPSQASDEARLEPNGEYQLSHAFELDATPGFERFFLVTSARPVEVGPVLAAAQRLANHPQQARKAPLSLSTELQQTSILLEKELP